jgi:hypothetical protein
MAGTLDVGDLLWQVLGSLRPGTGSNQKDLQDALDQVRAAVAAGQPSDSILTALHRKLTTVFSATPRASSLISAGLTAPLLLRDLPGVSDLAARLASPPTPPIAPPAGAARPAAVVALRQIPVSAPVPPLVAEWARGVSPVGSHGPFVNEGGERFWIDVYQTVRLVRLVFSPSPLLPPRVIALVPALDGIVRVGDALRLGAGSVWLPAALLVPTRPLNEFVGVRIKGGSLTLTGPAHRDNDTVTVSGDWHARLQLTLDPPAPSPAAPGVGADATNATVHLPATATMTFGAAGLQSIALSSSDCTAYGNSAAFTRTNDAPFYDDGTRSVVVPCHASIDRFTFATQVSTLFACGRVAPVKRAGLGLVTTVTTADKLGPAGGAGTLWLELGTGLTARWTGRASAARISKSVLQLAPGTISLAATTAALPVTQSFMLWEESPRRSSVAFEAPAGTIVYYFAQSGSEGVVAFGATVAHLDRPVAADGRRLSVSMPASAMALIETAADTQVYLLAVDPAASQKPAIAFALENLFIKTFSPALLWLHGPVADDGLASGTLNLRFQAQTLLPTLPDPYAANFESRGVRDGLVGWLTAAITWTDPADARLAFSIDTGATPGPAATHGELPLFGRELGSLFMLDVSSNADQFGVAVPLRSVSQLSIDRVAMVAPASWVGVFTLPPISWEPMLTRQPGPPDPVVAPPPNDGGPALLSADSVTLVPVAPTPLLREYVGAVNKDRHFLARLPLPFGIIGNIDTRTSAGDVPPVFIKTHGVFDMNRPRFDGSLRGGQQVRIVAPDSTIAGMSRHFPAPSHTDLEDTTDYARGILSDDIYRRWAGDFGTTAGKGLPLERYELSGYGASLFSNWRDTTAFGPAIVQARFDVLVGRTKYEVIQMQSTKYPWCATVVRTITIQRTNGGWVLREDSGWQPTTDGLFRFPASAVPDPLELKTPIVPAFSDAAGDIHRGAVRGVVNIRNIRLTGPVFPVGAVSFQPVQFDADVLIDPAVIVKGGLATPAGTRVPARNIDGYIHIDGPMKPHDRKPPAADPVSFVEPATKAEIAALLALKGPAVAPLSCTVSVGGTAVNPAVVLRAAHASVSCHENTANAHLPAALHGTPVLSRDGAWSLGRMKATDTAPNALDPQFAVPLVRPAIGSNGSDRWHLADPADIRRLGDLDKPNVIYGLLQSTGTQKTFFARPQALDAVAQIKVPQPPSFADVAALFNAAGIFPNLGDAFDFDTLKALAVTAGDINFDQQVTVKKVGGKPRETLLMNLGIVQILLRYADEKNNETVVRLKVGQAGGPRWAMTLQRVNLAVVYKNDDLIKLFADAKADAGTQPTFTNINVQYVGFLSVLQDIFSNIQQVARFLPGGAGAGLQVGFSQGRLTIRNEFALPNLPLGTGEITDVAVNIGLALQLSPLGVEFVAGIGRSDKPFRWVVSPLAGTGVVQVGVNNKGLDVLVQAGLGLGLAIDLGIAEGSAAITLGLELNTGVDPFLLKAILSGRASVDVMRGLTSVTITLAAGLGIIPPKNLLDLPVPPDFPKKLGPYTIGFVASVAVGIHISICWVVDIDWDDSWQFRQDITTPEVDLPF